jgi:hypothetical protein
MRYEEPQSATWADVDAAVALGDEDAIVDRLVGAVQSEPDWARSQEACLKLLQHPAMAVRSLSITCLGHVARIHRNIDRPKVLDALGRLAEEEPELEGRVDDALSDIKIFVPV